jgi:glycosyltransferase involved in cell wall biosynthesis
MANGGIPLPDSLSVLHVVAPAPFGGLESVLRSLASGHMRRGHTVRVAAVVSPREGPHPFAQALESEGVATTVITIGDRDYGGERRSIRELCRAERTDVVHTHGYRPDVVDSGVARSEGIGVVSTCHGFIDADLRARFYQWLQRRALRRFDAVIAVSRLIADRVRKAGVPAERIHLVPNVFASRAVPFPKGAAKRYLELPDVPAIGWVGRLSEEKGPDLALEAFARLARPDARLVMIGGGPDEPSLRRRAASLGIEDRVIWRGIVPNAGALFEAFDAFLLSSRTEGTPIALLEAIAARVPVVATRVGGVPDVINESSGLLVESGDVAGLAEALAHVLDDPGLAKARADRARARVVGDTAAEEWLSRYESIYRNVLR